MRTQFVASQITALNLFDCDRFGLPNQARTRIQAMHFLLFVNRYDRPLFGVLAP